MIESHWTLIAGSLLCLALFLSFKAHRLGMREITIVAAIFIASFVLIQAEKNFPFGRDVFFKGDDGVMIEFPNGAQVETDRWYFKSHLLDEGQEFVRPDCPESPECDYLSISGYPEQSRARYLSDSCGRDEVLVWGKDRAPGGGEVFLISSLPSD